MSVAADATPCYLSVNETYGPGPRDLEIDLVGDTWPDPVYLPESQIRMDLGRFVTRRWPYIQLTFTNAWAVYKVDTLDQGRWTGHLVEGAVWAPIQPAKKATP